MNIKLRGQESNAHKKRLNNTAFFPPGNIEQLFTYAVLSKLTVKDPHMILD